MNITFKKHKRETGLASIGAGDPSVDLKVKGKLIGMLISPNWRSKDNLWSIRIMAKTNEHPFWKWIELKFKPKSETEGREFIKNNQEKIFANFDLRYAED